MLGESVRQRTPECYWERMDKDEDGEGGRTQDSTNERESRRGENE